MSTEAIRRIEEIKARAMKAGGAGEAYGFMHRELPALCQALEIAVKALEEGKAARASQDVNQWVFALRKAEDTLAQIEEVLK